MSRQTRWPVAVDLFCGCGGLSLGLKQAGFRVIGAVDIDPLAVETYQANHRRAKVWQADIRELAARRLMRELGLRPGELDLLAGCPPCQGFSRIRTRNGNKPVDDPRNDLVYEFLRFVRVLKPKTVMMENVPALNSDVRIERFCKALNELGYAHDRRVADAADFGVPQRRRRMILLASRVRHRTIEFPEPQDERVTVRDAIGSLPPPERSSDNLHHFRDRRTARIMDLIRAVPADGGSRSSLGEDQQLDCHRRLDGFKDVYGRMAWNAVAPTITGGCVSPSKGRYLHPEQDRAITLREAALLQSFPPDYVISLRRGKLAAASLIGNALPPEFVRRHAKLLVGHLSKREGARHGGGSQVPSPHLSRARS